MSNSMDIDDSATTESMDVVATNDQHQALQRPSRQVVDQLLAHVQDSASVSSPHNALARIQATIKEVASTSSEEEWVTIVLQDVLLVPNSNIDTETEPVYHLQLLSILVAWKAEVYLPLIAAALSRIVTRHSRKSDDDDESRLVLSPSILKLWMHSMLETDLVAVHSQLSEALLQALPTQGLIVWKTVLEVLVTIWKSSTSSGATGVMPVRCATTLLSLYKNLGDAMFRLSKETQALNLLEETWKGPSADPLNQLCVFDVLLETWSATEAAEVQVTEEVRSWLTDSDAVVRPLLGLLSDPLVSGTVLSVLSWICTLFTSNEAERQRKLATLVLDYIATEIGVTTNEEDRLRVLQACSRLAQDATTLSLLVEHPQNPCECWLDVSRISSSKLQSAVLISLSQVLRVVPLVQGKALYQSLTRHNGIAHGTSSTDWILSKFVTSPFPEVQVAAFTVWSSLIDNALAVTEETESASATSLVWNLFLGPASPDFLPWVWAAERASTPDARTAKFVVLQGIQKLLQTASSTVVMVSLSAIHPAKTPEELQAHLSKVLALGPHGMESIQWSLATE